jgi:hypothetical protein
MLGPVLSASYRSRHDLKDAVRRWSSSHAKECGTGFFNVKLQTWRRSGLTRGNAGFVRCCVKGCGWHLKIEEADAGVDSEGQPRVEVCVYDYNIAHTTGGHAAVDATRVELANTPGWACMPEALHGLISLCSNAGRSPSDTLHLLDAAAAERGIVKSWDYQVVYRHLQKLGQKQMGKKKRNGAAVEDAVAKIAKADVRAAVFSAVGPLATILESCPSALVGALEALGEVTREVEAKIIRERPTKKKKRAPPAPPATTTGVTPDVGENAPAVEDDVKVTMETFGGNPDEVQVQNPSCAPVSGAPARARKKSAWLR